MYFPSNTVTVIQCISGFLVGSLVADWMNARQQKRKNMADLRNLKNRGIIADRIFAKTITLTNENMKPRCIMGTSPEGVTNVTMYDKDGHPRIFMFLSSAEEVHCGLSIMDAQGHVVKSIDNITEDVDGSSKAQGS